MTFSSLIYILITVTLIIKANSIWTEQDEADRIAMIIAEEKKIYEQEIRSQQSSRPRSDTRSAFQSARERLGYKDTVAESSAARRFPESSFAAPPVPSDSSSPEGHWCYHCTTPMDKLSAAMKRTIKEFLKVRRTTYPQAVATPECLSSRNHSLLHKQQCRHRYCQTFSLVDDNEGASFVLRGCAENFGAIDTEQLEAQKENTCTRLHDKVDIKECICKERRYCFASGRRTNSGSWTSWLTNILGLILLTC